MMSGDREAFSVINDNSDDREQNVFSHKCNSDNWERGFPALNDNSGDRETTFLVISDNLAKRESFSGAKSQWQASQRKPPASHPEPPWSPCAGRLSPRTQAHQLGRQGCNRHSQPGCYFRPVQTVREAPTQSDGARWLNSVRAVLVHGTGAAAGGHSARLGPGRPHHCPRAAQAVGPQKPCASVPCLHRPHHPGEAGKTGCMVGVGLGTPSPPPSLWRVLPGPPCSASLLLLCHLIVPRLIGLLQ